MVGIIHIFKRRNEKRTHIHMSDTMNDVHRLNDTKRYSYRHRANTYTCIIPIVNIQKLSNRTSRNATNSNLNNTLQLVHKLNRISPYTSDIKGTSPDLQDITVPLQKHVSVLNAVSVISIIVLLLLIIKSHRSKLQRWEQRFVSILQKTME